MQPRTIVASTNNLAGVILTSEKLKFFKDTWRNKKDVTVCVDFSTYKEFLTDEHYSDLCAYLQAGTYFANAEYTVQYSRFVQDICLAQIFEIVWANSCSKYASTIIWAADPLQRLSISRLTRDLKYNLVDWGERIYRQHAIRNKALLYTELYTDAGKYNNNLFTYAINSIGFASIAQREGFTYSWTLDTK